MTTKKMVLNTYDSWTTIGGHDHQGTKLMCPYIGWKRDRNFFFGFLLNFSCKPRFENANNAVCRGMWYFMKRLADVSVFLGK